MPSIQHTRTVHYLKAGPAGPKGDDGAAYWLVAEPSSVVRRKDGTLSAESVSVTAYKSVGDAVSLAAEGWLGWLEYHGGLLVEKSVSASQTRTVPVPTSGTSVQVWLTARRHGGETLASVTIPIVEDGHDGQPGQAGERGAIIRELVWEDMPSDFVFYEGAEGEPYQDKVLYRAEGHYLCVHTHAKGEEDDDPPHCSWWQEVPYWPAIATKVLLAERSKIGNLYVSDLEVVDDSRPANPRRVARVNKDEVTFAGEVSFDGAVRARSLSLPVRFPENGSVLGGTLNIVEANYDPNDDKVYFLPELPGGYSMTMDLVIYKRHQCSARTAVLTGGTEDVFVTLGANFGNFVSGGDEAAALAGSVTLDKTGLVRLIGFADMAGLSEQTHNKTIWLVHYVDNSDAVNREIVVNNPTRPHGGQLSDIMGDWTPF